MSRPKTPAQDAAPVRPRAAADGMTVGPVAEPGQTTPRRWDAVTDHWATLRRDLRAGVRIVRQTPGHAVEDPHAERVAAAGMGLLVLVGAIVTYVAVVGGIDPLLSPSPAGGAPPVIVPTVTPTPTADPTGPTATPSPSPSG